MNIDEVRSKISQSKNPNLFNSLNVEIRYNHIEQSYKFSSFITLFEFVSSQVEGWSKIVPQAPDLSEDALRKHQNLLSNLIDFLDQNSETEETERFNRNWKNGIQPYVDYLKSKFTYDSKETEFLIEVYKKSPDAYTGAYYYIIGQNIPNQRENFRGALLAHDFLNKGVDYQNKRIDIEFKAVDNLKNKFTELLSNSETYYQNKLNANNLLVKNMVEEFIDYRKFKEKEINDWQVQADSTFDEFHEQSKSKIKDLERTYEEQLRLKKPAEHWKDRATKLRTEGDKFRTYLFTLIIFGSICVYLLLWKTPEGMLDNVFGGDKSAAIRWSIIFIVFMSLIFLGIRYIAKAMFSSYHLARDAEEREQLMFVYLAMIKDAAVDEKDKHLIMQSLFSRADTGLLREDSSPTMPGILDKTMQR